MRHGPPRDPRGVQLADLGGDAVDGVGVDVAVVEGHVDADAVVADDRRVDEVGPAQRVRDPVEAVLEVPGEVGRVREVADVLAVQGHGVRVEREPPHRVAALAAPPETAAQRLVPQRPGPQRLLEHVEIDRPRDVEGGTEPGRHEQAVLAHRPCRPDVRLLDVRGRARVLGQRRRDVERPGTERPLDEAPGTDLAALDVGHSHEEVSVRRCTDPTKGMPSPRPRTWCVDTVQRNGWPLERRYAPTGRPPFTLSPCTLHASPVTPGTRAGRPPPPASTGSAR